MPCVAMTPAMPTPADGRCGATAPATSASASVRPLPRHRSFSESNTTPVSTSAYTRFWKFLFQHWNTAPTLLDKSESSMPRRRRRTTPSRLSVNSEMRQHVQMLHEIETEPQFRGPRAMQTTCANCHQRFFRAHGTASTEISKGKAIEYCSLDCRSSAQYRATVQHSIDCNTVFDDSATLSSTPTTSRL